MFSRAAYAAFAATSLLTGCSHTAASTANQDGATADTGGTLGPRPAAFSVLTQHNDPARTGANTAETCLTQAVAPTLTQRAALHVDGLIFAQPLLFAGSRYLAIVATSTNQLTAFDATTLSSTPVWQLGQETFGTPGNVKPGPGPLGILSTPVIDPATSKLYLLARSCPSTTAVTGCPQAVHVVDAVSGKHLDSVTVSGGFTDADGGAHPFDPDTQMNRPGLLLQGGKLVVAWGVMTPQPGKTHEGDVVYHGTVMAFDTTNLHAPPIFYVDTPRGFGGGIWQSGGGVAGDGTSVYFNTGNSTRGPGVTPKAPTEFPATPLDQENSVVRLQWGSGTATPAWYYDPRPYHSDGNVFQYTNYYDYDLASSGLGLIPDSNELVAGSKGGIIYALDRTTMQSTQDPISAFHRKTLPAGQTLYIANDDGPEILGAPVIWRRKAGSVDDALVYWWPRNEFLTSLHYDHGTGAIEVAAVSADAAGAGGGALSFTSNGTTASSALLWASVSLGNGGGTEPAFVRAYDPLTLKMLWQGAVPGYPKFVCPTIAAGRVYMPSWPASGGSDLLVFGAPACGD